MKDSLRIIGLSGTNGSGKDTVGHLLASKYNYMFVSVSDLLREELKRRGLPVEREYLRELSAEWRRESGYGVLVDKAMELFEQQGGQYAGLVMASLRNPYEADHVHQHGGSVIWVDADPHVRYERITANAHARGRASEDNRTFEQFLADEAAEMHPPEGADAAMLHMAAVKERADIFIENDGNDIPAFEQQVITALGL